MASKQLMDLVNDRGFQRRVRFAMFSVAKDKAQEGVAAGSDDEAYIDAILNGQNDVILLAVGVAVTNANAKTADDASLKTGVTALWPHYAAAWKRGNA